LVPLLFLCPALLPFEGRSVERLTDQDSEDHVTATHAFEPGKLYVNYSYTQAKNGSLAEKSDAKDLSPCQ